MMTECHSGAETGTLLAVNIRLLFRSHPCLSNLPLKAKPTQHAAGLYEDRGKKGKKPNQTNKPQTPQGCLEDNEFPILTPFIPASEHMQPTSASPYKLLSPEP